MITRNPRLVSAGPATDRRQLACLLLAALALLMLAPDAGAAPAPGERAPSIRTAHCALKGSRTIAANRHVRVFRAGDRVLGCRRRATRAYELGVVGECQNNDEIDDAVVAGDLVALNVRTCGLYFSESRVVLVSLRSGRGLFGSPPSATRPPPEYGYGAIRGMVLTAAGRFGWIAVGVVRGGVVTAEVRRRGRGAIRSSVLLDSGADIDPRSLRRRGARASWRRGGVPRSARL